MVPHDSIFHALYYGTIHPWEKTTKSNEHEKTVKNACVLEEQLLATLDAKAQTQLLALLEENAQISTFYAEEKFKEGFVIGARLMIETLSNQ